MRHKSFTRSSITSTTGSLRNCMERNNISTSICRLIDTSSLGSSDYFRKRARSLEFDERKTMMNEMCWLRWKMTSKDARSVIDCWTHFDFFFQVMNYLDHDSNDDTEWPASFDLFSDPFYWSADAIVRWLIINDVMMFSRLIDVLLSVLSLVTDERSVRISIISSYSFLW